MVDPLHCIGTVGSDTSLVEFGLWLLKRGNRESTVERKLKYLRELKGSPEQMFTQVLAKDRSDKRAIKCFGNLFAECWKQSDKVKIGKVKPNSAVIFFETKWSKDCDDPKRGFQTIIGIIAIILGILGIMGIFV